MILLITYFGAFILGNVLGLIIKHFMNKMSTKGSEPEGYNLPPSQKVWTPSPSDEDLMKMQDPKGRYLFVDALTKGLLTPNEFREMILGFNTVLTSEEAEKTKQKYIQEARLGRPIIVPHGITMSVTMLEQACQDIDQHPRKSRIIYGDDKPVGIIYDS